MKYIFVLIYEHKKFNQEIKQKALLKLHKFKDSFKHERI